MKRLVIIGNGNGVLDSKKRDFIDSSDLVIRMNNIRIEGYEDFVGTKFDIYSCTPKYILQIDWTDEQRFADVERRYKEENLDEQFRDRYLETYKYPKIESTKLKEILISYTSHNGIVKRELTNHSEDKFPFARLPFSEKIKSCNFGTTFKHTTGFKTIRYCLEHYKDYEKFITGFDFYLSSGWYWDKEPWPKRHTINEGSDHCYNLEKERVNQLIKDGVINEI